ncbi:MAG TPA: phosphatase PAP2 family protein [Candidatus Marinimicrobia bacterium]|nr:phosphatase PAP2 family protein [Candidatus Neomarinimicrobiota bacterium]
MKRLVIFLFLTGIALSENLFVKTDFILSTALEGKNNSAVMDYAMEGLALSTSFFEFGYAGILQLESDVINPLTASTLGVQLPIAIGKYVFKRERPNRQYKPRLWNSRWTPSFPSGHTATTAAWATTFALTVPNTQPIMIGYTLISGYSQVYVGNHYVSDIIAGWFIGWATARFIHYSFESNSLKSMETPLLRISIPL